MKPLGRKIPGMAFAKGEDGVVMTEALVAVPFLFLLAVGVLEFGAVLWEREQIETGLRDAARYMARCRHVSGCDTVARNLAYHGTVDGSGALRVPGWDTGTSPITFAVAGTSVTASTTHQMVTSPLFGVLNIDGISVTLTHTQRVIGW